MLASSPNARVVCSNAKLTDCRQTAHQLANSAFETLKCVFGQAHKPRANSPPTGCELCICRDQDVVVMSAVTPNAHLSGSNALLAGSRAVPRQTVSYAHILSAVFHRVCEHLIVPSTFILSQTSSGQARRQSVVFAGEE